MTKMDYLKLLVDEIHSTTVATIGSDGHPQTRIIDMMYYDEEGVYFLTAKGKAFYDQLMDQQYFDISNPSNIVRDTITIGKTEAVQTGYYIGKECIGCKLCYSVCPQKCIDISSVPVTINQNHCLHCGRCAEICPKQCIEKRG